MTLPRLAAAFLLALAAAARGETRVVDPATDLAATLAAAAPGDTIVVRGGVHEGCFVLDRPVMVTPEHARMVMEVYIAADLSAESNQPVALPLASPKSVRAVA